MGRLIGIELDNFKSYRGKAHIGFGTSFFTSIIGPNGSGKSNMMDAISFVLGIRSNQLRSKNLKSLIYRGRINDEENDENIEDINLDEYHNPGDPDSAYVMAVYEKDNGDILELKRAIIPSAASVFSINGTTVSVNQYSQVLKDENILIKARNFLVFQGDVEKIASQSPQELTNLIETISGSINYKKEFDEFKDEKESAHDITALKNTQKRNLKDELKALKAKCQEVDQYDLKTTELEKTVRIKYLSKLEYNERSSRNSQKYLKSKTKKSEELTVAITAKKEEYKDFVKSQADENMSIKEYEQKIENDENTLRSVKTMLIPLESEVSQLKKKVNDYDKRIKTLETERDKQIEIVEENQDLLSTITNAYKNFQSKKCYEMQDLGEKVSYSSNLEMLTDYNVLRERFLLKAGDLESILRELKEERDTTISQIDNLESTKLLVNSRIQDLEANRTDISLKEYEIQTNMRFTKSTIKNQKRELNSLKSLRESIRQEVQTVKSELKEVLLRLNEISAIQRESLREKKLRETCSTLKRLFTGVKGLLHDLCKPKQKKYDIALAAILGKNFDAIIVDKLSTASECIQYMKEQRIGVASFIPLDAVQFTPLDVKLRSITERARPTIDVVSFAPEYEKAINYACGNSLICDTMDVASSIRWGKNVNVKLVTLEGSLIHKSGLMTGGISENLSKKWDKTEWKTLMQKKDELTLKMNELISQKPSDLREKMILDEIERLESLLPSLQTLSDDVSRKLHDVKAEIGHERNKLEKLDIEIRTFTPEANRLTQSVDSKENEYEQIQDSVYSEFCEKYNFANINEYLTKHGSRLSKDSKENTKFVKEIQRLENKLQFESERLSEYEDRVKTLKQDREKFHQNWTKLELEKKDVENRIDIITGELEVTKEDYKELMNMVKGKFSKLHDLESDLNELVTESNDIKKAITHLEEELETLRMNKKNILINCKLENVGISLNFGSLDEIPLEDDESKSQEDIAGQWEIILEDLEVDYDELEEEYIVDDKGDTEEKIKQKIEKLQEETSVMNPDMRARERLAVTQERFDEVEHEFTIAKDAEKVVVFKFDEVKTKRFDFFTKAFNHISEKIDAVYKELTKAKNSLGGSAYLSLEDEDDPYLFGIKYHVMPPMKRFREMENLSGGEKTIAALALLFAIHSFHPSPFFVLDEVDAALDNANVNKIANYITTHSGPNFQFIVISLKNSLFEKSDALVGIYRDQGLNSSKILTLDLRSYPDEE